MIKTVVMMSVYNGSRFISEQIESIVNQDIIQQNDYEIELCIRIDGSKDDSAQIIRRYSDQINISVYDEENVGPEKSFWRLLNLAPEADFYSFADQDDYWFSDKLSRAVSCLEKEDPNIPNLYCSSVQPTDEHLNPLANTKITISPHTDFPHALIYSLGAGCTFVFNKAAMQQARKYDMESNFVEMHDWLLHKIVAMTGRVHYDSKPSMYYRQHGTNVIGENSTGIKNLIRRGKRILFTNSSIRCENARSLRTVYSDWLKDHPEEKRILDLVSDYREDRKIKKEFLHERAFRINSNKDLIFRALIILEKI